MPGEPGEGERRSAIARRAGIVAAGTLTSRILGAVRDAVIAASFPAAATDAFFVAFTIPNVLRVLLGEGAVSGAFVPVFAEVREKEGSERARQYFAGLSGTMAVILVLVTAAGMVATPWVVLVFAAGWKQDQPDTFDTTVTLTRLVFPYIFLMGVGSLAVGALNALKRFAAPAFAPSLLNVALIAAALTLVPTMATLGLPAIAALAFGALLGGALQTGALLPALARVSMLVRPRLGLRDPYVRKSLELLAPLLLGLGVYQVNVMLSRLFASYLPEGSQSYLYYGQRVVEIPQGMFAFAIASAALPTLSELRSRGHTEEVKRIFGYGLRLNLFVAIPATVALVVLAHPTVAVLFTRGEFGAGEAAETARSLVWQAAGIWAVASVRTVVPMFHAHNDTRSPVICSAVNLVVFVTTALALMGPLRHVGIAIAISTAAAAQLMALLFLLRRRTGRLGLRAVGAATLRIALASGVMGAAVWGVARLGSWERGGNDHENIAIYLVAVIVGAAVYVGGAKLLGVSELDDVLGAVRRRRGS